MRAAVEEHGRLDFDEDVWRELAKGMRYVAADSVEEASGGPITDTLARLEAERGTQGNRVFYLAVPPAAMTGVVGGIATWPSTAGWRRLIVEKPFGHDLASAHALNAHILERFPEREVFRIDHYLGKETCRTSRCCASRTGFSSPSGIGSSSTTSRSRRQSLSGSARVPVSTKKPARHATYSRTTSCSYSR